MAADLIKDLAAATLANSAAILLMATLRTPLRRTAGSRLVYAAWLVVPLATAVVFLPAPPAWLPPFAPEPAATVLVPDPSGPARFDWTPVILAVWLGGAAAGLAAVAALQHRALRRLRRGAAPGPAVVGVIASRIVLPSDFEHRYSPEERAVILAHEQVHLAVGDVRVNAAVALFSCLFWFNPLVHLAARLVRADQELSCDEAVIARHPQARRTYAEALLKTQLSSSSMPLGCYWPERSHHALKERLNMLTLKTPGRRRRLAGAALVCSLGLGTGYVAWASAPKDPQPPQADGFSLTNAKEEARTPVAPSGYVYVLAPDAARPPRKPPVLVTAREWETIYAPKGYIAFGPIAPAQREYRPASPDRPRINYEVRGGKVVAMIDLDTGARTPIDPPVSQRQFFGAGRGVAQPAPAPGGDITVEIQPGPNRGFSVETRSTEPITPSQDEDWIAFNRVGVRDAVTGEVIVPVQSLDPGQ